MIDAQHLLHYLRQFALFECLFALQLSIKDALVLRESIGGISAVIRGRTREILKLWFASNGNLKSFYLISVFLVFVYMKTFNFAEHVLILKEYFIPIRWETGFAGVRAIPEKRILDLVAA